MELDRHSISEKYSYDVRSLYFDDAFSTSLDEKEMASSFAVNIVSEFTITPVGLLNWNVNIKILI